VPKFSGSEVVRHGQISLSQLGNLVETAAAAAMPYVNGFAYGSQFGSAIVQAGPETTVIVSSFINTSDASQFPVFSQLAMSSITVDGTQGLLFYQNGVGGNTLAIQPASATVPGVVTTQGQFFSGNKWFYDSVSIGPNNVLNTNRVCAINGVATIYGGAEIYGTGLTSFKINGASTGTGTSLTISTTTLSINGTPAFTGTVPAGKSLTVVNGFIIGYQ